MKDDLIIDISEEVSYVIEGLKASGFQAYIVGGSVRDSLMGRCPKDFDVTTDATPCDVMEIFSLKADEKQREGSDVVEKNSKVIDTGSKHGTVTVIHNHIPVEVTTFRKDSVYSDGRHPDSVFFSKCIEEDLARRDFTMNAIAFSPEETIRESEEKSSAGRKSGKLIDPFKGREDIENGIIRAVGNPEERFKEDALRMLRAIRFASTLGFEIEENTKKAIFDNKEDILLKVSAERIQKELEGILTGDNVESVLREYVQVIGVVIPEILPMVGFDQHTPFHIYDVWEHSIRVVSGMPPEPIGRLAALFHDIGKPSSFLMGEDGVGHFFGHPEVSYKMAEAIMSRLKFDNATKGDVLSLVRWHDLRPEVTDKSVRKTIMKVGPRLFDKWIDIKRADNWAQAPLVSDRQEKIDEIRNIGHRLMEEEGALSLKTLDITGIDIMNLGVKQGPEIGKIMNALLEEVMEERIPNSKAELTKKASQMIKESMK